jgi:predicted metal-dependent hydrolase
VARCTTRSRVPWLIAKLEPVLDVSVARWSIRRMKNKRGSCNRETRHIWSNVERAKPESVDGPVI